MLTETGAENAGEPGRMGLVVRRSAHSPRATVDRLAARVAALNMTVFARIDHAAGAHDAGLALRPTELLVFGSARAGTPLMQLAQTAGIDLPLKILVWEDENALTWIGYNDPVWIASRHGLASDAAPALAAMKKTLAEIVTDGAEAGETGAHG